IENILGALDGRWLLLSGCLDQIVADCVRNCVWTAANNARRDQALTLRPFASAVLSLPIVKNCNAVRVGGIVSSADCLGVVAFWTAIKACDPRARNRAAVVTQTQALRDLRKIGCSTCRQTRASGSGLKRRMPRGAYQ